MIRDYDCGSHFGLGTSHSPFPRRLSPFALCRLPLIISNLQSGRASPLLRIHGQRGCICHSAPAPDYKKNNLTRQPLPTHSCNPCDLFLLLSSPSLPKKPPRPLLPLGLKRCGAAWSVRRGIYINVIPFISVGRGWLVDQLTNSRGYRYHIISYRLKVERRGKLGTQIVHSAPDQIRIMTNQPNTSTYARA